jgi:hypothetical protein
LKNRKVVFAKLLENTFKKIKKAPVDRG